MAEARRHLVRIGAARKPRRVVAPTAIALSLLATLPLASCSQPSSHMQVGILYRGGPSSGNSNVLRPGVVQVFRLDGSVAATANLADGTTAQIDLSPGPYRFAAHSGDAQCLPQVATVRSGDHGTLRLTCSVK